MPVKQQRRCALLLFAGYVLLSVITITRTWHDMGKTASGSAIQHIKNPVLLQGKPWVSPKDSIAKIIKNRMYERERKY